MRLSDRERPRIIGRSRSALAAGFAALASAATAAGSPPPATDPPGILTFFTPTTKPHARAAGLHDPSVVGAELIIWWRDVEPVEGRYDWSVIDGALAEWASGGKKLDLRLATAHEGPFYTPAWVHEKYGVRRIGRGAFADFETTSALLGFAPAGTGPFVIPAGSAMISDGPLAGARSLHEGPDRTALSLDLTAVPAFPNAGGARVASSTYSVQFDYRLLDGARGWLEIDDPPAAPRRIPFADACSGRRTPGADGPASTTATHSMLLSTGRGGRARLTWGSMGGGGVTLDNVGVIRCEGRTTVFPDYFDPEFQRLWERLVTALGQHYAGDPRLGRVSVGGFGRWEEVILETEEDGPGRLVPQWMSRGYTPARYAAHIADCMDLYRRALPGKPLRLCLAYGLARCPDEDFIYRRTATDAVARGIGLKQNGMTERFDSWDTNTNASYLFQDHAETPGIDLTFETAGQVYRNHMDVTGHPLSLMNRVLTGGADHLLLYPGDVSGRNISKYFPTTVAQLGGAALFTEAYARLGEFAMTNEHSPKPVPYLHQWIGMRPLPEVPTSATVVNGDRCAMTTPAGGAVAFDLDDRMQRAGMHGVMFIAEVLDRGRDEVALRALDQTTRQWTEVARLRKTDTGNWRPLCGRLPAGAVNSTRASGEDVHRDLEIADLGDGPEWVRGAQIDYVPAAGWARDPGGDYATTVTTDGVLGAAKATARRLGDDLVGIELPEPVAFPFAGLRVGAGIPMSLPLAGDARLQRQTPDGRWLDMTPIRISVVPGEGGFRARFEPQTAGRYRLVATGAFAGAVMGLGRDLGVTPLELIRARRSNPAVPMAVRGVKLESWGGGVSTGTAIRSEGWKAAGGLKPASPAGWPMRAKFAGAHPALESPGGLGIAAATDQWFRVRIRNGSPAGLARLYWAAPGKGFHPGASVYLPMVANDTEMRDVVFPVGLEAGWTAGPGIIDRLRLELAAGLTVAGTVEIEEIALEGPATRP